MTMLVELFGGQGHRQTFTVERASEELWVTTTTGEPHAAPAHTAHGSLALLLRARGFWESYARLCTGPDGRVGYWCTRPLDRRPAEFVDAIPIAIPIDEAAQEQLISIHRSISQAGPNPVAQWAAITTFMDRLEASAGWPLSRGHSSLSNPLGIR